MNIFKSIYGMTPVDLVRKWENIKRKDGSPSALNIKEIANPNTKLSMACLLENQCVGDGELILGEAAEGISTLSNIGGTTDGSSNSDSYKFQPIAMAIVRRAMPELFAHKVVGVQPMATPVGLAYAIRKIYASNNTDSIEAGWEQIDKWGGYTGSSRQTSAILSQQSSGIYDTSATGANALSAETWDLDPTSGTWPQLKTIVDKKTIEAITRKLGTSYSLESAQDISAMLGVDIEREMVSFLQYEIIAELDRELLFRMKKAATTTALDGETITAVDVSGTAIDGRWSQEKYANIISAIVHQQNKLAQKNRMGRGNFVVVSPGIATALQAAPAGVFNAVDAKTDGFTGMTEIGTMNGGSMKVYYDSYAHTEYALVGYHGANPSENGVIYSPYITGLKRAIAENTFAPRIGAYHRYAITDTLLGSGRFYRLIPFSNVGEIVPTA